MKTTTILYYQLKIKYPIVLCMAFFLLVSCEDYLEIDEPFGQIPNREIFSNETTATAAVTTLYGTLRDEVLVTGNSTGIGVLMGLYADELDFYGMPWELSQTFYRHQILASDVAVKTLWDKAYNLIYRCNSVLEGLEASVALEEEIKRPLKGETRFVRALVHFYLMNLFGEVPYITTTDYKVNSKVERMQVDLVYENILADLNEAKSLLGENYVAGERIRANTWVVSALLARTYLYMEQWQKAETQSSLLINKTSLFSLEENLADEFLKESSSAILQLKPKNAGSNAKEAGTFIFTTPPPPFVALNNNLVDAMEDDDLRKQNWIEKATDGTNTWFYAYKYKHYLNTGVSLEYSIVFRLAEQYLIRAEARARQGNILGAQHDLNVIRQRAGLENTTAVTPEELLEAILAERRFELFTEHGHRWFDLQRLGRADEVLGPVKDGWKPTDVLLPIPEADLLANPNLAPQNPGY